MGHDVKPISLMYTNSESIGTVLAQKSVGITNRRTVKSKNKRQSCVNQKITTSHNTATTEGESGQPMWDCYVGQNVRPAWNVTGITASSTNKNNGAAS